MTYGTSASSGMDRRRYLRATGACIGVPLLSSWMRVRAAEAAGDTKDSIASSHARMVCIGVALGMYREEWVPKEIGPSYESPELIQPLDRLRGDFTLFSNVDHPNVTGGHKGVPAFLSGVYEPQRVGQSLVIRNQVTVDQYAADRLGDDTRFRSLQLSAAEPNANDLLSWTKKGVALASQHDPLKVYSQLFIEDANPDHAAKMMKSGRSVLDLVQEDAKSISKGLSKSDRQIMDQYMASVRDVELGIARQLDWLTTPKPTVPPIQARPTTYHENLDLLLDLIALALQTDSTRVCSLMMPSGGLPIDSTTGVRTANYHNYSHHGKDPQAVAQLVAIEKMHMASLGRFLDRLKDIKTDRGDLLDCTQVLFGSGLGNGSSHSNRDLPVLLAGGGHRHAGHVRCEEGTPLTNLFVSMLRQMNIETTSFADSNGDFDSWLS